MLDIGTTSCVSCLRGATGSAITTVWCSAAWNYEYKAGLDYPGAAEVTGAFHPETNDQGTCCYAASTMSAVYDQSALTGQRNLLNKWTCPSKFSSGWAAGGSADDTVAKLALKASSWWCSDGSYVLEASTAQGTAGSTSSSFAGDKANWPVDNTASAADNYRQLLQQPDYDRRFDLFLAACRQRVDICGGTSLVIDDKDPSTMARQPSADFTKSEKCTWILQSKSKAPTFSISNEAAGKLEDKYDIVYQEWIEGWQLVKGVDYLEHTSPNSYSSTSSSGGIVLPHLRGTQYQKAAKYNYAASGLDNLMMEQQQGTAWMYVTPPDQGKWNEGLSFSSG